MKTLVYITFALLIFYINSVSPAAKPSVEITKLECNVLDDKYLIFKKCSLTKGSDGQSVLNAHIIPLQNIDNVKVKVKMMRKLGKTYRPYYFETLLDVCDFLKDYKHQIPWGLVYERVAKYTNINHSCPYYHDLILKDYSPAVVSMGLLPIPKGAYLIHATVMTNRLAKATFQLFFVRNF